MCHHVFHIFMSAIITCIWRTVCPLSLTLGPHTTHHIVGKTHPQFPPSAWQWQTDDAISSLLTYTTHPQHNAYSMMQYYSTSHKMCVQLHIQTKNNYNAIPQLWILSNRLQTSLCHGHFWH